MSQNCDQISRRSRFRGCLLGLAAGDALGTTLEFTVPGSFTPITDMVGGGPFCLAPGEWTDDTSMALCLAESLVEKNGFDPVDQLERYVRWYRTGHLASNGVCFDIGNTTREALHRFERTKEAYPGSQSPYSAGSGSIMRLAPVPMFFAHQPTLAFTRCGDSSRTTHACQQAIDACRYYGMLISMALNDQPREVFLADPREWDLGTSDLTTGISSLEASILEVAQGSYRRKHPPEIQGSGYVVKGMEAALWAFNNSSAFREGALLAANLGDDADTTCAIYGQLAGAYYGEEGIPEEWRSKLALHGLIIDFADRIFELAGEQ